MSRHSRESHVVDFSFADLHKIIVASTKKINSENVIALD